jgi:A/G-specific adenine glycosylase
VYEFICRKRPTLNAQRPTLNSEFWYCRFGVGRSTFASILISRQEARIFCRSLLRWYRRHGRDLPWRRTRDPYAVLLSEFMLQQTQVATVLPYYNEWLRRFPDFASLARASQSDVLHAWQGLGYYARARNLHAAAKAVVERHGGHLPNSIGRMHSLPGIGKYTAHAIATFAFDQSVPIVEANSARVLARIFNLQTPIDEAAGRKALWNKAAQLVPERGAARFNSALVDLGALICLPRKPKCRICPVRKFCCAPNPEILPLKKARPRTKRLTEHHAFVVRQNKILLEQAGRRWYGMWILPRLRLRSTINPAIHSSIFPFTNHRIRLKVFSEPPPRMPMPGQRWFLIAQLAFIPLPSPHRRALEQLLKSQPQKLGSARAAA